jgi:hypothetical protein
MVLLMNMLFSVIKNVVLAVEMNARINAVPWLSIVYSKSAPDLTCLPLMALS